MQSQKQYYVPMKRSIILLIIMVVAAVGASAQKPVYESATQTFGYKTADPP